MWRPKKCRTWSLPVREHAALSVAIAVCASTCAAVPNQCPLYADEPVWAIGTGLVCPEEVAQEVHAFIRSTVAKKYGADIARRTIIQYSGSVNVANVKELMAQPDIDGCLVGGASLTADSFAKIVGFEKL